MSVVDRLLLFAKTDALRPHIPIDLWAWLKKQPSLPLGCRGQIEVTVRDVAQRVWGRREGNGMDVVHHVRGLGDLDILKSYFHLVWSEWNTLDGPGFAEMQVSIAEDLGGIGEWHHREDLIKRLDRVLRELNRVLPGHTIEEPLTWLIESRRRKEQYRTLREALLQADRKATKNLTGMSRVDHF